MSMFLSSLAHYVLAQVLERPENYLVIQIQMNCKTQLKNAQSPMLNSCFKTNITWIGNFMLLESSRVCHPYKIPIIFTFVQKCVWSIPEGVAGNGRSPSRDNRWQASGGSVAHSHVRPGGCGDACQMSTTYHSKCPLSKARGENSLKNVVLVMTMQYKNIQIPLNSLAIQRKQKWLKIYLIEGCNFVLRGAVK